MPRKSAGLAAVCLSHDEATRFVESLRDRTGCARVAIRATAALGDAASIPLLLGDARVPALARLAGCALETITGIAIDSALRSAPPPGFVSGPTDDPDDEDMTLDPDDGLPWPDVDALTEALTRAERWVPDERHVLGRPVDRRALLDALARASQPARALAAFELARATPRLFDIAAPSHRQLRALAAAERA